MLICNWFFLKRKKNWWLVKWCKEISCAAAREMHVILTLRFLTSWFFTSSSAFSPFIAVTSRSSFQSLHIQAVELRSNVAGKPINLRYSAAKLSGNYLFILKVLSQIQINFSLQIYILDLFLILVNSEYVDLNMILRLYS